MKLTKDQEAALTSIQRWLTNDKENKYKTLAGYAGTGKTTLLDYVVQFADSEHFSTLVTATTNKAVKVLREKIDHREFSTIHSALQIRPVRKGGTEVFEPAVDYEDEDETIENFDLIIVDECSMISQKLLGFIERGSRPEQKILFCGDPAQLQPINETISKCFDFIPSLLTEVVRHGDAIANKAKLVRETDLYIPWNNLHQQPEIVPTTRVALKKLAQGFRDNPDKLRLLCWTNNMVDKWNRILREFDYGKKLDLFVPGDIIIANQPCSVPKSTPFGMVMKTVMQNSEEAEVTKVKKGDDSYTLTVKLMNGREEKLRVVLPEYKQKLNQYLKSLAAQKNWKEFWKTKESYHDVKHCYAMTVHKSQGSTFKTVVLDRNNIDLNREMENRNQLVYVGMTRASDNVKLI